MKFDPARAVFCLVVSLVLLSYWQFNQNLLQQGHLHEDAYIMFQYVRNMVEGLGIVFDRVHGHTEGATDFLWLQILALLHWLGLDIATSAVLANTAGLFAILVGIARIRGRLDAITAAAAVSVIFSGGLAAAVGGFSTLAYGGLFTWLCVVALERRWAWLALLVTFIGLFRPDGVILGACALLASLWGQYFSHGKRIPLWCFVVPAFVGAGYFLWRWNYFGLPLPLPLLVKQRTDIPFEGFISNKDALMGYWPLLALGLWFGVQKSARDLLVLWVGVFVFFIALGFAHQSQNIGYRFQFPIVLALIFAYAKFVPAVTWRPSLAWLLVLVPLLYLRAGYDEIRWNQKYLLNQEYINQFPQWLKSEGFMVNRVAITEAGRFPYWYDCASMTDLVGLNSAQVVTNGAASALENDKPSLIFVHQAGRFKFKGLESNENYRRVPLIDIELNDYVGTNPVYLAPAYALKYARRHDFQAVVVRYGGHPDHVYFLHPALDMSRFLSALERSFRSPISYRLSAIQMP